MAAAVAWLEVVYSDSYWQISNRLHANSIVFFTNTLRATLLLSWKPLPPMKSAGTLELAARHIALLA